MFDRLLSLGLRTLFTVAAILLLVGIWDRILRLFDLTLTWVPHAPARLLELSAILAIFTIPLLLRQIREEVKKKAP